MNVPRDVMHGLDAIGWRAAGEFGCWGLGAKPIDPYKTRYYNVATAASITGWVRAFLWRAICDCDGVLYCDTDSIAARVIGANITIGDKLGEWVNEGEFTRAGIAGKKLYVFENEENGDFKMASKGARLTPAEMWSVAQGGVVEFTPENPTFSVHRAPISDAWQNPQIERKMFTTRKIRKTAIVT